MLESSISPPDWYPQSRGLAALGWFQATLGGDRLDFLGDQTAFP
ncbi:hypothetical protein [Phormidesmis sp. 146-35]